MSTPVAVRYNPVLKVFYQRLCARGQSQESGPDGLYAHVVDDPERHGETSDPMATTGGVYRLKIFNGSLTIKTVALLLRRCGYRWRLTPGVNALSPN
jgi:hypothetical protein